MKHHKKTFNEGYSQIYTLEGLRIDKIVDFKQIKNGVYEYEATIRPGLIKYSYDGDDYPENRKLEIEGGMVRGEYTICGVDYYTGDEYDDPEMELMQVVGRHTLNFQAEDAVSVENTISFHENEIIDEISDAPIGIKFVEIILAQ
jgi:hypothetical protein